MFSISIVYSEIYGGRNGVFYVNMIFLNYSEFNILNSRFDRERKVIFRF